MVQKEPKRRGRPREYDPDAALVRATESFWERGYSGTSLDELSEATGMNRPSLYGAFGDKRDLYLKTLAHYREEGRALARQALADQPTLRVFLGLLNEGILMTQRGLGACSLAMTDEDVDRFINALARVLARG